MERRQGRRKEAHAAWSRDRAHTEYCFCFNTSVHALSVRLPCRAVLQESKFTVLSATAVSAALAALMAYARGAYTKRVLVPCSYSYGHG